MRLIPVQRQVSSKEGSQEKKILFYRHPQDPGMTSRIPTQDAQGVQFIPVYEADTDDAGYYGCGMEGAEHTFFIKGLKNMTCPICGMKLKELSKQEAESLMGVVGRVQIKVEQTELAGLRTQIVEKLHLFKEIRTVGKVAYDPGLVIAEEEFVSSLRALDRMQATDVAEIKERALNLVASAKRKLRLLGLSDSQIEEMEASRKIHTNLILPEEKMWIYGEVYEYELSWLKEGSKVKVTTASLAGEEFDGVVSSVNPVLDSKTRSVTFRVQVDNPNLKLKPQMYVDVVISAMYVSPEGEHTVIAIPKEAVLNTGVRRIVWVDKSYGEYEGRQVEVGPEAIAEVGGRKSKYYPILKGLKEGELVVTRANFLIDSQSQITGSASSAYGGALGEDEDVPSAMPAGHQH